MELCVDQLETAGGKSATGSCTHEKSIGTEASAIADPPKHAYSVGSVTGAGASETTFEGKGCCAGESACEKTLSSDNTLPASLSASHTVDVEKAGFGSEHVVISVSGMTCTGCETMLRRSLASLPSIKNVKTSLILSRAEFDVNLSAVAATEAIRHVERTTKFKCCRITDEGSELDIIPSGGVHDFLRQEMPCGVTSIERVDKTTVRVCFDAKVIGAWRLLEEGFHTPAQLAPPRADPALAAGSRHVRHVGYMTLFSSLLTIPVLVLAWAPIRKRPIADGLASLVLATVVQVVVAGPFYTSALKALVFARMVEMDLLIVLSTSAAYVFSLVSFGFLARGRPLSTGDFFETSALLVTLIMVGRFVSALARQKAVESISIRSLQAPTAVLAAAAAASEGGGATEREIDSRLLQYGDVFKVAPDSRIPTDGTVVSGSSAVDESMITGESRPGRRRLAPQSLPAPSTARACCWFGLHAYRRITRSAPSLTWLTKRSCRSRNSRTLLTWSQQILFTS